MSTVVTQSKQGRYLLKDTLARYGLISDKMIDYFETVTGLTSKKIAEHLEHIFTTLSNPAEYLSSNGEECDSEEATYFWVYTGLEDIYKKEELYLGFTKGNKERDLYSTGYYCYYIAPKKTLEKNIEYFSENILKAEESHNTLLSEIYDLLLIKGEWGKLPNYEILGELLKLAESKIANDEKNGTPEKNCVYNEDHTKIAYNPGLVSIYGNDIIIIATLEQNGEVTNRKIAQSKTQMKQEGFKKVEIPPVCFYETRKDLLFSATAEDFDLDDFGRIRHIIEHRRERFPEEVKDLPDDELFNKIRASLEFDLKMTARNPYWAAPFYNIKQDEIQYLLPLFTGSLSDKPRLAMIVGKGEHYYEVRTVLSLQRAYANAACLASPPSTWLGG